MTALPVRSIIRSSRPTTVRSAARCAVERLEDRRLFTVSLLSAVSTPISATPSGDPAAPVIADFDGDTLPDVLVAFPSPTAIDSGFIQFGKGDGAGTFAFSAAVDIGIFTGRPVVGDFNGDSLLDIAVTNAFGGEVKVLRGAGNGSFGSISAFAAGTSPEPLAAGDFNGDALSDLVAGNRSSNNISVYLGNATTTLGAATTINTATDPSTLAIADFNLDTHLDIIVGASGGTGSAAGALQVFTGDGTGTISTTPVLTIGPRGVTAVANIDGDQGPDVIVGVSNNDKADALVNNGGGAFTLTAGSTGGSATKAAVAIDMDEDGRIDLVTAVDGQIDVLRGLGNGNFAKVVSFDAAGGSGPAVADVSGDGRPDVLTITATAGQTANRTLNVSIGRRIGPDLSIAIVSAVPPSALAGQNAEIKVRITNNGNEKLSAQTPVQLYSSADTTVDVNDALLRQLVPKLTLGVGKGKTLKIKFSHDAIAGVYNLIARVDPGGSTGDLNLFDNATISANTITLAPAFIDLSGQLQGVPVTTVTTKTSVKLSLVVTNLGNIVAKGRVNFAAVASVDSTPDESSDFLLKPLSPSFKINPGQTKTVKLNFKMPALPPATYFFLGIIEQGNSFIDAEPLNNVAVGAPQVVVV